VHPNRRDFALAHPDARQLRNAARLDAEIRQGIDQHLLDSPHVSAHVAIPFPQVQYGIAHYLSRPVIGDVAATICGMEGDAGAGHDIVAGQQVFHVTVAAHRDRVGVLQQDELVGDGAHLALRHQPLLPLERGAVLHPARFLPLALTH
jgi:hypothetical protein